MYPNPSKDLFSLNFNSIIDEVTIMISDVHGSILQSKKYSNTNYIQLNLENEALFSNHYPFGYCFLIFRINSSNPFNLSS
ncbi:T9SS type A sorting domain-containing protein [Mariniflexile litorale]|uniref:T9SS type A sorting domain-containing protein n=1 Tax=Mariniflexile litorale TaxID=3045158 RepID=UPI0034DB5DE4